MMFTPDDPIDADWCFLLKHNEATVTPSVHKFINDVLVAIGPWCCEPQFTNGRPLIHKRNLADVIVGLWF